MADHCTELKNLGIHLQNIGIQIQNIGMTIPIMRIEIQNLGLQISKIGNQIFNIGINYFNQLMQINNMHNLFNQMQNINAINNQNFMENNIFNNNNINYNNNQKLNIIFDTNHGWENVITTFDTTIEDLLNTFLKKKNIIKEREKNNFFFLFNGKKIDLKNKKTIEEFGLIEGSHIIFLEKLNLIGGP